MKNVKRSDGSQSTSRRDFLKTSAVVGGTSLVGGLSIGRSAHAAGSDTLKIGLIGCGSRGRGAAVNVADVDKGTKLVAMGDAFADRVEHTRSILKKARPDFVEVDAAHSFVGFDAYQKVIDSDVDVVLLATPPQFRPLHTKACIDANKHVFAEKPMAVDATGIREFLAASKEAEKKGLSLLSGLCWRYNHCAQETVKRIHDGAIGDIVAVYANSLRGTLWRFDRKPEWTEMEYQMRNWYYFDWLSGDNNVEQHVHGLDKCTWALGEKVPVKAWSIGGRQVRELGNVYDHHAVVYEYADGMKLHAMHRQQAGCYNEYTETLIGTKGTCEMHKGIIKGENAWRYRRVRSNAKNAAFLTKNGKAAKLPNEYGNMHQNEQDVFIKAIRSGTPINAADYACQSTLIGILGRMASYTGKEITWDQIQNSQQNLSPKQYSFDAVPPVVPDAEGKYPVPQPGLTPFV